VKTDRVFPGGCGTTRWARGDFFCCKNWKRGQGLEVEFFSSSSFLSSSSLNEKKSLIGFFFLSLSLSSLSLSLLSLSSLSLSLRSLFLSLKTNTSNMSILPEELPYGWPGPPGNAAAERLSRLPAGGSQPSFFSRKRAVAKEIVQCVKAVLGGVEGVHEALLKALDREEVRLFGARGEGKKKK